MSLKHINNKDFEAGLLEMLEEILRSSFQTFLGLELLSFENVSDAYNEGGNQLFLPPGIYTQMGFGNTYIEGAIIFCGSEGPLLELSQNLSHGQNLVLAIDVVGELSNIVGGKMLNSQLLVDAYDALSLAPPVKFMNQGGVRYFENEDGLNLILKLKFKESFILVGFLIKSRIPFYTKFPSDECSPVVL